MVDELMADERLICRSTELLNSTELRSESVRRKNIITS